MANDSNIKKILELGNTILTSQNTRKLLCGEYDDGTPRSIVDAINGEYMSPKQKKEMYSKKRSKKRKEEVDDYSWTEIKKKKKKKKKKKDKDELGVGIFF